MSRETRSALDFDGECLESVLVSRRDGLTRPGVVIFPTVMGVSPLELGFAHLSVADADPDTGRQFLNHRRALKD